MTKEQQEYWQGEYQKCKESFVYYYNNYTKEGKERPITQEMYDKMKDLSQHPWKRNFITGRRH